MYLLSSVPNFFLSSLLSQLTRTQAKCRRSPPKSAKTVFLTFAERQTIRKSLMHICRHAPPLHMSTSFLINYNILKLRWNFFSSISPDWSLFFLSNFHKFLPQRRGIVSKYYLLHYTATALKIDYMVRSFRFFSGH